MKEKEIPKVPTNFYELSLEASRLAKKPPIELSDIK